MVENALAEVEAARVLLGDRLHRTPMVESSALDAELGARLTLKAELFQKTGSYKVRSLDRAEVGRFVRATYADPRGWTAGGRWRFRQVGPGEAYDHTLMLVTPATRDDLCGHGYDRYTSCRIQDRVVLNIARWVNGVPSYGASLQAYRQYMINHETGHRLGHGHELCPSPGAPAPVMEQQTLGLHGCTANAWPYLDGERYRGRPGQYDDPTPVD